MRMQCALVALALGLAAGACGGRVAGPDQGTEGVEIENGGATQNGGAASSTPSRAPMNHRPVAESCDHERPPGGVADSYEGAPCTTDEDCTEGTNGRCLDRRGASCTYDECFEDSECTTGGPCGCERGFWSDANACLQGNCQIDADCGEGGYCSPSFGSCGAYSGVVAYWCRTPADTCVEDDECVDPERGAGYCAFYPEVGYWACQYGQCVG